MENVTASAVQACDWTMELRSGKMLNLHDIQSSSIVMEDIVHALSNLCRFGGHCRKFYSVAQHSVLVSQVVHSLGGSIVSQRYALLHDAAEAYLGDFIRPIKRDLYRHVACLRPMDEAIDHVVVEKFVRPDIQTIDRRLVTHADNVALATEKRDLLGDAEWSGRLPEPFGETIVPMDQEEAASVFWARLRDLGIDNGLGEER